jgi:hypothetical protein
MFWHYENQTIQIYMLFLLFFPTIFVEPHSLERRIYGFQGMRFDPKTVFMEKDCFFFCLNQDIDIEIWNYWQRINLKNCRQ